jgi:hypothetical protein
MVNGVPGGIVPEAGIERSHGTPARIVNGRGVGHPSTVRTSGRAESVAPKKSVGGDHVIVGEQVPRAVGLGVALAVGDGVGRDVSVAVARAVAVAAAAGALGPGGIGFEVGGGLGLAAASDREPAGDPATTTVDGAGPDAAALTAAAPVLATTAGLAEGSGSPAGDGPGPRIWAMTAPTVTKINRTAAAPRNNGSRRRRFGREPAATSRSTSSASVGASKRPV